MKRILLLGVLLGSAAYAQDVAGDWKGTISTPQLLVRVALHIVKSDSGGLKATMDSIDQGAMGMAINKISLTGGTLKFTVDAAQGTYEGKVGPAAIDGLWTQAGMPFALKFERGVFATVVHKPAKPTEMDGDWSGNLKTPRGSERITIHIANTTEGLTATMESQSNVWPVANVIRTGTKLRLEIKAIAAVFEGDLASDRHHIRGSFTQDGTTAPLVLQK